jgi:vacuolar-type H+-ATPase subunit H
MEDSREKADQGIGRTGSSGVAQARSEAEHVADEARADAGAVVDEARHQAGEVVVEARDRAGELVVDARDRLHEQADAQAGRLAESMRGFSTDLESMADHSEHPDTGVAEIARELAGGVERVAGRLDDRGIDGALDDVRHYARRYPGRFLLGAAAAGFVVGRLLRNVDSGAITGGGGGGRSPETARSDVDSLGYQPSPGASPVGGSR